MGSSNHQTFDCVVVSAPSGTGKTTLNRRLMHDYPNIEISISYTTRAPRPGEIEGVHYYFIDEPTFEKMIQDKAFIEWARVHGNLYGTTQAELQRIRKLGHIPLLEIDVQGWLKAREYLANAISIFILPPDLRSLWQRLENRASDSLRTRMVRLQNAYHEIAKADHYHYFLINDDLEMAYLKLKSMIIDAQPGDIDARNGRKYCDKLKTEFYNADWIQKVRDELGSPA